jgi:hypothetical protein
MPEDNEEWRTRVSYTRVGLFVLGVAVLIILVGDNPVSRVFDDIIKSVGSLLGLAAKDAKPWFSGRSERVYRLAALGMVLIAFVAVVKLIIRGKSRK